MIQQNFQNPKNQKAMMKYAEKKEKKTGTTLTKEDIIKQKMCAVSKSMG